MRSSPKSTVKRRRRLYSKQPSSTSVSLPLELPDAKLRDSALIDHCLSPEAPSTTNVSFFQFRYSLEPKIPGNLACLSRAIAKYFPNAVKEMGEPCISGLWKNLCHTSQASQRQNLRAEHCLRRCSFPNCVGTCRRWGVCSTEILRSLAD
jgi:hypothetical protein